MIQSDWIIDQRADTLDCVFARFAISGTEGEMQGRSVRGGADGAQLVQRSWDMAKKVGKKTAVFLEFSNY